MLRRLIVKGNAAIRRQRRNGFGCAVRLLAAIALTAVAAFGQQKGEETELAETLMRQLVDFTAKALAEMDPNLPGFVPRHSSHTHDPDPSYAMAFLYKTPHPLNPYYRKEEIRNSAIAIGDRIVAEKMRPEWPLYLVCQVYNLLKNEIPEQKAQAWRAYAADYISTRGMQPFGYTSPNHEAWNALAIYRAGQVFGEEAWETHGSRLMQQLFKIQTALGYFDEGKHHGPAMKYNQVQLAPMLLFHDYSKDPAALLASKKLADFMIRYSFPDGSPIGAFDGRQSYSLGYYGTLCYGLDRWPLGKELNRRIYRTRKKRNILQVSNPHYSFSDWYSYFGTFFLVDEYRSLRPEAPVDPLPQDRSGYRMLERGPSFHGGVARQHDWMIAVSAIDSDVPRYSRGPYQLERQSRLDIWHADTGLVIGGGSNMVGADVPLANFILVTGHRGPDVDFGLLSGGEIRDRQAVYFPRTVDVAVEPGVQRLEAHFGHGDFSITVRPHSRTRLELSYTYDILTAQKAFVQFPLILFHDSSVRVDGKSFDKESGAKIAGEILLENATTQSAVKISVPRGKNTFLRPAIYPLRWYGGEHKDQRYSPYYQIALLSIALESPVGKGGGTLVLEIVN